MEEHQFANLIKRFVEGPRAPDVDASGTLEISSLDEEGSASTTDTS
jgi:hypothetical protein